MRIFLVIFLSFFLFSAFGVSQALAVEDYLCRQCNDDTDCGGKAATCVGDPNTEDTLKQGVCQNPTAFTVCNPLRTTKFTDIVNNILTIIFNLALVVTPIMIVWTGVLFITGQGEPVKVTQAKHMLLWIVVGLSTIILAKGAVLIIRAILGF